MGRKGRQEGPKRGANFNVVSVLEALQAVVAGLERRWGRKTRSGGGA